MSFIDTSFNSSIPINQHETIICDWDVPIQLFDYEIVKRIENINKEKEIKDIDLSFFLDNGYNNTLTREKYTYQELFEKETDKIFFSNLFEQVYNDITFYDKCPYTSLSESLQKMTKLHTVDKIIFLSHINEDFSKSNDSKINAFNKLKINSEVPDKMSLYLLNSSLSKAEWIQNNYPNYTTFIDDRADIVKEVILKTDSANKTFLIPIMGYNKNYFNEFMNLSKEKMCDISYYKLF